MQTYKNSNSHEKLKHWLRKLNIALRDFGTTSSNVHFEIAFVVVAAVVSDVNV